MLERFYCNKTTKREPLPYILAACSTSSDQARYLLFSGFIVDGVVVEIFIVTLALEDKILRVLQAIFDYGFGSFTILHIAFNCKRGCASRLDCK